MKRKYLKEDVVKFIKGLDVRAKTLDDAAIDNVIDRGYAELSTVSKRIFSNEDVTPLQDFYTNSEDVITLDIEEDVTEIYDLYLTKEDEKLTEGNIHEVVQGIGIYRNVHIVYRDNRYTGRFHVRLADIDDTFDNVVAKYYYTPRAFTEYVFMDSQTYLAWTDAMWAALNYFLKDIEGEAQKRASMTRTSKSIPQEPEDTVVQQRAVFNGVS